MQQPPCASSSVQCSCRLCLLGCLGREASFLPVLQTSNTFWEYSAPWWSPDCSPSPASQDQCIPPMTGCPSDFSQALGMGLQPFAPKDSRDSAGHFPAPWGPQCFLIIHVNSGIGVGAVSGDSCLKSAKQVFRFSRSRCAEENQRLQRWEEKGEGEKDGRLEIPVWRNPQQKEKGLLCKCVLPFFWTGLWEQGCWKETFQPCSCPSSMPSLCSTCLFIP